MSLMTALESGKRAGSTLNPPYYSENSRVQCSHGLVHVYHFTKTPKHTFDQRDVQTKEVSQYDELRTDCIFRDYVCRQVCSRTAVNYSFEE